MTNPTSLQRAVTATAREVPTRHQFDVVRVRAEEAATRLLQASDIQRMEIETHVPGTCLVNSAIAKGVSHLTDDQLLDMTRNQDVDRTRRLLHRRHHGSDEWMPTDEAILGFEVNEERSKLLRLRCQSTN